MKKLAKIYEELYDMDVILFAGHRRLPDDTDAMVIEWNDSYGIFYDLNQIDTPEKELLAASHEWAHIVTGATYTMGATPAMIQRAELRASRAQIKKLLSFEELSEAIHLGYTEPFALADHLELPEQIVRQAIDYYTGSCGLSFAN